MANENQPKPSRQYTPELKLQVVLAYIRNPRSKKRIIKENGISEELLDQWHQEFLKKAGSVFGDSSPAVAPSQEQTTAEPRTGSETRPEPMVEPGSLSWGMKLNRGYRESYYAPSSSRECPSWARGFYRDEWEHKSGLVLWDDTSQKIEHLWAGQALRLLERLRQDEHWRADGFPITRIVRHYRPKQEPKPKISRKKKKEAQKPSPETTQPTVEEAKPEYDDVEEEIIRLTLQASAELFDLLQQHEPLLNEMAQADEKRKQEAFTRVYTILFQGHHEHEAQDADLSQRTLPWVHHADTHTLVCDVPPNRGTVRLSEDRWFWEAYIERPDQIIHHSPYFFELEKALAWTEQELLSSKEDPQQEEKPVDSGVSSTKSTIDLTPYRIDPTALEPARVTFRAVIYMERVPEQFKTMEMSFGKVMRYDEKFPSPWKLMNELQLDDSVVKFEQLTDFNFGWYFLFSTATYYEEPVARAQAQKLWDGSTVQRLYKDGKVTRARYGIEEVETGYRTWLGGLEDPKRPWQQPETRAEHMAKWAKEETIVYALDVVRLRESRRLSPEDISDEKLLSILHERRARSKHIPIEARAESERWLASHVNIR